MWQTATSMLPFPIAKPVFVDFTLTIFLMKFQIHYYLFIIIRLLFDLSVHMPIG
jgi:hypothetical protein